MRSKRKNCWKFPSKDQLDKNSLIEVLFSLNNTQEKGLSSFENCEVDVLTVYPNQQNGQPGSAIYKNAIVKFIDDFVVINDEMLVPKNNILRIKKK